MILRLIRNILVKGERCPREGQGSSVVVPMDQEEVESPELDEISQISMATTIRARSSDVSGISYGDAFTINSKDSTVREFSMMEPELGTLSQKKMKVPVRK